VRFLSASSVLGFGRYPTYASLEIGAGSNTAFLGSGFALGPVLRLDPNLGYGLGGRVNQDVFFLQLGARAMVIVAPQTELVLLATIGVGRY
jgi:hypothetical protein